MGFGLIITPYRMAGRVLGGGGVVLVELGLVVGAEAVADAVAVVVAEAVAVGGVVAVAVAVAEAVAVSVAVAVGVADADPAGGVSVGFGSLHPASTRDTPSMAAGSALLTPPAQNGHEAPSRTCLRQTEQG